MSKKRTKVGNYKKVPTQKKYELVRSMQMNKNSLRKVKFIKNRLRKIWPSITPLLKPFSFSTEKTNWKILLSFAIIKIMKTVKNLLILSKLQDTDLVHLKTKLTITSKFNVPITHKRITCNKKIHNSRTNFHKVKVLYLVIITVQETRVLIMIIIKVNRRNSVKIQSPKRKKSHEKTWLRTMKQQSIKEISKKR